LSGRASLRATAPRAIALAASLLALAPLAGCGLGPGSAPTSVQLAVTRDFGASTLRSWSAPRIKGEETVMSLLMRNARVSTRYGGGFVQSIDGLAGGHEGGAPVDWFYYVNGIEAPKGAAATTVHPGDHIWWDRHDWSVTDRIPAIVGSFPEPFLNGIEGKRLPVSVECAAPHAPACSRVTDRLRAAGVPAAVAGLGSEIGALQTLRITVAPFSALERDPGVLKLADGPRASGVFARFEGGGATLALLDEGARAMRRLGAGTGLVAATRAGEEAPVWVVTGTDEAGVARAASAFDATTLHDRFALAVEPGGGVQSLPLRGSS
jgi:Domain of unknown function (DUF4430)